MLTISKYNRGDYVRITTDDEQEEVLFAAGFNDGNIRLYSFALKKQQEVELNLKQTFEKKHESSVNSLLQFEHFSNLLASASYDQSIQIWYRDSNSDEFKFKQTLADGHTSHVVKLVDLTKTLISKSHRAIIDDQLLMGSCSADKKIIIWHKPASSSDDSEHKFTKRQLLTDPNLNFMQDLIYLTSYNVLVSGCYESASKINVIRFWSNDGEKFDVMHKENPLQVNSNIWSFLEMVEHSLMITGHQDGSILVWKQNVLNQFEIAQTLSGFHRSEVYCLLKIKKKINDQLEFVSGSYDSSLNVFAFDASKNEFVHRQKIEKHNSFVWSLISLVSKTDTTIFASSSQDKTLKIWSTS
jgi:WD40 repeat protein